jgi:hypothetical protein
VATHIFSKQGQWSDLSWREACTTPMGVAQRDVVPTASRFRPRGSAGTSFCSLETKRAKGAVGMTCQRCLSTEPRFRAVTDLMDITVCAACAEEAQRLGIPVEPLARGSSATLPERYRPCRVPSLSPIPVMSLAAGRSPDRTRFCVRNWHSAGSNKLINSTGFELSLIILQPFAGAQHLNS